MKSFKPLFIISIIALSLTISCKKKHHGPHAFKAVFFTDLISFEPSEGCPIPHTFLNTQEGSGRATLVGNLTTRITFCVDPTTFKYIDGEGSFVAKNGDELFFTIEGQVLPSENPDYDLEFMDPFIITGGTGHFANASGSGMTDSLVKQSTGRTDHTWTGTISFDD